MSVGTTQKGAYNGMPDRYPPYSVGRRQSEEITDNIKLNICLEN